MKKNVSNGFPEFSIVFFQVLSIGLGRQVEDRVKFWNKSDCWKLKSGSWQHLDCTSNEKGEGNSFVLIKCDSSIYHVFFLKNYIFRQGKLELWCMFNRWWKLHLSPKDPITTIDNFFDFSKYKSFIIDFEYNCTTDNRINFGFQNPNDTRLEIWHDQPIENTVLRLRNNKTIYNSLDIGRNIIIPNNITSVQINRHYQRYEFMVNGERFTLNTKLNDFSMFYVRKWHSGELYIHGLKATIISCVTCREIFCPQRYLFFISIVLGFS